MWRIPAAVGRFLGKGVRGAGRAVARHPGLTAAGVGAVGAYHFVPKMTGEMAREIGAHILNPEVQNTLRRANEIMALATSPNPEDFARYEKIVGAPLDQLQTEIAKLRALGETLTSDDPAKQQEIQKKLDLAAERLAEIPERATKSFIPSIPVIAGTATGALGGALLADVLIHRLFGDEPETAEDESKKWLTTRRLGGLAGLVGGGVLGAVLAKYLEGLPTHDYRNLPSE